MRKAIVDRLRRSMGGDFVVVGAPDHPLVMRSVDIIVGGRAGLTAIMAMTAQELRSQEHFTARLTLNKMALPPHTNFVFVSIDGERPYSLPTNAFVTEISIKDQRVWDDLTSISSRPQGFPDGKSSEKIHRLASARFGDTYKLARVLQRGRSKATAAHGNRSTRKPRRDRLSHNIEAAFFANPPTLQAIANLSVEGADRWYDMDGAEPFPTQAPAGAAFAELFPSSPGDPDKAIRAAAFAGWVLTPAGTGKSPDEISELVSRYTRVG
ncbi:hypothetical protein IC614_02155 [Allosphingosinicella flava]|uniref:Uncharacterized protein n=1 Tax=Allosphingosinicella flava TaxID=2771430 RepID=A0A7T2LMC1_9SPHN|nr:hypothetical protein [Sphingosinicella flava]QPQ55435.1 hypothetical protein IC614_02155 [Sphingosinicella flava]